MNNALEWDDALAPRARKLAADVIARSGLECERGPINAGTWDADDHVIIAMEATMQTARAEGLLREALNALNLIPRKRLHSTEHPDTYKLASAIEDYFKEVKNG